MTRSSAASKLTLIRWDRFETACKVVEQARDGLIHVLLTGRGEPLLYPSEIGGYLVRMKGRFPLVEIQTNGVSVADVAESNLWETWKAGGLTQVCISITHIDPARSNQIMGIEAQYNYWDAAKYLKAVGFSVRLNCTMVRSGTHTPWQVDDLIDRCAMNGVDKLTLREVEAPSNSQDAEAAEWVKDEKPHGAAARLRQHLELRGAHRLLELPHGGIVYDVDGQNVAVSTCLTRTTDPDDIRQIIFFPDGRISYDWQHTGARIL
jgi:molybdenum cofactor biosynthesis enzyme MoaA